MPDALIEYAGHEEVMAVADRIISEHHEVIERLAHA